MTAGAVAGIAVAGLAYDLLASRAGSTTDAAARSARLAPAAGAAVSVVALLWLAPLTGALELAGANGWGRGLISALGVEGLPGPEGAGGLVPERYWWWWDATRLLPGVIAEFPAFSLLLGDLHAHLLALPLGVLALALAASDLPGREPLSPRRWLQAPLRLGLASALYAALAMTNSWDAVTWGAVWLLAAAAALARAGWPWPLALLLGVRYLALPALGAVVLALPFAVPLERPALGLALVSGAGSEPLRFALFWLAPALPVALATLWLRPRARRGALARGVLLAAAPVAAWAGATLATAGPEALSGRGSGWLTLAALALCAGGAGALALASDRAGRRAEAASLGLACSAASLLLATELLFVTDAFGTRMNTVFKLWFHAWLLLALAGGAGVGAALGRRGEDGSAEAGAAARRRAPARAPAALSAVGLAVLLASLAYAPAAAVSRGREGQVPSLDALSFLDRAAPGEAAAVRWARSELAPRGALMLEAVSPELRGREPGLRGERRPDAPRLAGAPAAVAARAGARGARCARRARLRRGRNPRGAAPALRARRDARLPGLRGAAAARGRRGGALLRLAGRLRGARRAHRPAAPLSGSGRKGAKYDPRAAPGRGARKGMEAG